MANANRGLGRGLGALLGDAALQTESADSLYLPISQVESCAGQPRKHFDDAALADLADSIREHGIIQPLTVRKLASGYYQIIAGERRWRAARLAGLTQVPAIVIEADDRKAMELALIENLQREDLNPIEEAEGYKTRVLFSNVFFAQHICHVAVGSNTHDSLDRKVCIVSEVSGKVIRTKLVLRIKTILYQIIRPGCQSFPMLLCVVGISFYSSNRCSKDYHIARFFDWHIASVSLAVSQRICTYVVSSKRFGPFSAFTIIEDMVHGSFHQFRIVV